MEMGDQIPIVGGEFTMETGMGGRIHQSTMSETDVKLDVV